MICLLHLGHALFQEHLQGALPALFIIEGFVNFTKIADSNDV
jgi:hypothetical protein